MKSKIKNPGGRNRAELVAFDRVKAAQGLKTSIKRASIVRYFFQKDRHYTAEELYDELKPRHPAISFSTVYRALKLLASCNLALERHFDRGVTRFEPAHRHEHHDHLVCLQCGRIIEFADRDLEATQSAIARRYRFQVASHRLEMYGCCRSCRQKKHRRGNY